MDNSKLSKTIAINTKYNIIGRLWQMLVIFFLFPYIIKHIGLERFGIYAIIGVVTGYFGLFDFGIGTSFVKYIAEFSTKKEYKKIDHIVNTGFILYFFFAILIIVIFLFLAAPILSILKITPILHDEAMQVFLIGIALFGASNALSPFRAILIGFQRMDILNKIEIVISIPNIIGTIFFLEKGYGLLGLMLNNVIIFILTSVMNIYFAFKILPQLKFNLFDFNKEMSKILLNFGYKIQLAKISGVVTNQTDKILIAYFLSIGLVTFYQLGSTVVVYVMSISALFVSALMPAFSSIEAKGQREKLIEVYFKSTKYLTFLMMPIYLFTIISASQIMTIWMGQGYERSAFVIQALILGFMINSIAQIAASTSMAIDKPQLMATGSIIIITLNIILSIFLIKIFGFFGVAWGTMLAVNIGTIYFIIKLHKMLKISLIAIVNLVTPYFAIALFAAIVVLGFDSIISLFCISFNRFILLVFLFVRGAVFLSIYFISVYLGKFFDSNDIDLLKVVCSQIITKKQIK